MSVIIRGSVIIRDSGFFHLVSPPSSASYIHLMDHVAAQAPAISSSSLYSSQQNEESVKICMSLPLRTLLDFMYTHSSSTYFPSTRP